MHNIDQGWATGGPQAFFIWPALNFQIALGIGIPVDFAALSLEATHPQNSH